MYYIHRSRLTVDGCRRCYHPAATHVAFIYALGALFPAT